MAAGGRRHTRKPGKASAKRKRPPERKESATGTYIFDKSGNLVKVSSRIPSICKSDGGGSDDADFDKAGESSGSEDFSSDSSDLD